MVTREQESRRDERPAHHANVGDAVLLERLALGAEAQALVEGPRRDLGVEHRLAQAGGRELGEHRLHQQHADAVPAAVPPDRDALDFADAGCGLAPAQSADHLAVLAGHEVGGAGLEGVELELGRHTLLLDEHGEAEREGRLQVLRRLHLGYGRRQAALRRWLSRIGWAKAKPPATRSADATKRRSSSGRFASSPDCRSGLAASSRPRASSSEATSTRLA